MGAIRIMANAKDSKNSQAEEGVVLILIRGENVGFQLEVTKFYDSELMELPNCL
jgi:hypothetical protein